MSLINELETAIPDFDRILEAKFELLHNCLILSEVKNQFLPVELANKTYETAFENFKNDPLDVNNHYYKLTILRDILLSDY